MSDIPRRWIATCQWQASQIALTMVNAETTGESVTENTEARVVGQLESGGESS